MWGQSGPLPSERGLGKSLPMALNYEEILGSETSQLLQYKAKVSNESLHRPGPDVVDRLFSVSNRSERVLRSLQTLYSSGRLANTGYTSIFPVDQGIEHSAGASFAPNPVFFDPENIVKFALEAECNAVATTYGVLASVSRKYAHKIPFILKINHHEFLSYPNKFDQILFASVKQAHELGAVAVGATIYFGSPESGRQIVEVSKVFEMAHEMGMATVLWCYLRNNGFKNAEGDFHAAADLTGQANHLGVTLGADIIKQKLPTNNGGYKSIKFGKTHDKVYSELSSDNPIDLCRYQVLNCYSGRIGLINSGGESKGASDLAEAVRTAVINKRAGGMGLIAGRKAFQRPWKEGLSLIRSIQDVYLDPKVSLA